MIYGEEVLIKHENLIKIKGDIRNQKLLKKYIPDIMQLYIWHVYQTIPVLS